MGLIRKTLAVGTVGVVKPSSKKQRVAKATMKAAQEQVRFQKQQAAEEHAYRYATDPVYKKYIDDKQAAAQAARAAQIARRKEQARAVGHGLVVVTAGLSMVVLGVLVWAPQLAIGKVQHKPVDKWLYSRLRNLMR